ncbi:MAG: cob(I)yrinic acid a,c-diamide adenosyltransferase [Bacillota bacterium]|nr:MAG: cob(I)yrinic acid a,c-diamide adenosyltransferase [Bacillota bacterium]
MKIYTKRGDQGETSLLGGKRARKSDSRVEAYGTVDEVVALIAFARASVNSRKSGELLLKVEKELFKLAAELACPEPEKVLKDRISEEDIRWLEDRIDELMGEVEFRRDFIIPGPYRSSASLHMARTVARRAERVAVRLSEEENVRPEVLKYLNRLSDFLYALALYEEKEEVVKKSVEEIKKMVSQEAGVESLNLESALKIIKKAEEKALEIKKPMCVAVVDAGGHLLAFHRMDGALLASVELAVNKAFTAAVLKMETSKLSELAKPGGELFGIESAFGGRIVIFGGGIPLFKGGKLIGAVGVSGGTVDEDVAVAKAGITAI